MGLNHSKVEQNESYQFPINNLSDLHFNTTTSALIESAIRRGEGKFSASGAFAVETGHHTGRSAQDKFVVCDDLTRDTVWWDNTKALSPEHFDLILQDFIDHANDKDLFVQDLYAGADLDHRLQTRVILEYAWHALFIRNLLICPSEGDLQNFDPEFTIVNLPSFRANPERHGVRSDTVIACDFTRKLVLIGGTSYAGETKKSVFSYLNFALPEKSVMPMHCSANVGDDDDTAIFFGLSGTGKTTLSADPNRTLLGDDEHGWSENGIYNFEGGCYAKTVNLCAETEPEIYAASNKFGSILENVKLTSETRLPDFRDTSLTENTRSAYPLHYIKNASSAGLAGHPKNIIMLTADAFGILPPIAKLTPDQAMYHFLSGYTAKVAGTEKGVKDVTATFSTCFGAPFMPRHPCVYGNLLRDLIARHEVDCWLVNTGWTAGQYGVGYRMPIQVTRTLLTAALNGSLSNQSMRLDPLFGFEVPLSVEGIDTQLLTPRDTWNDPQAYDAQAAKLVQMFQENFKRFEDMVDAQVCLAAPALSQAAE